MKRSGVLIWIFALLLAGVGVPWCIATCGGGGGGGMGGAVPSSSMGGSQMPMGDSSSSRPERDDGTVYRVPWTLLDAGKDLSGLKESSMILIWFPSRVEVARDSKLHSSKVITTANERCVTPVLVTLENESLHKLYQVAPGDQAVVFTGPDGTEITRVQADVSGFLSVHAVERVMQEEFVRREKEMTALLDSAQKRVKSGDKTAVADLQRVWAVRCMFPKLGKKAAKALKKQGIEVSQTDLEHLGADTLAEADVFNIHGDVEALLKRGLEAELAARYRVAEGFYREACETDPADTTALRYLGELYRHQTGEWDKAGRTFRQILMQPSDRIARAVALHGLGKMTIHAGSNAAGLRMFQESIATYPLPITYRNLAVFWFSEGESEKATGCMRQALALDPYDTYNQIFAAVYLAAAGHKEEAIKVARANESVLEASYNLAAIWAQVGDRAKAMELLRRHFQDYERFAAVRAMEMKEARDDYMFASLHRDPEFLKLTEQARAAYLVGAEWCSPDQLINQPEVPVRMPGGQ